MVKWYKDAGLSVLDQQMRDMYPGIVIYGIGDEEHRERQSAHNPEEDGSVDASDFMLRGKFGKAEAEWFFNRMIAIKDPRFANAIWNRKIVSSTVRPWEVRAYKGDDPHTDHVHLEVNDKHENDKKEWHLMEKMRKNDVKLDGLRLPTVRKGENDNVVGGYNHVVRIQRLVGAGVDGVWGDETTQKLKEAIGGSGLQVSKIEWMLLYGLTAGE